MCREGYQKKLWGYLLQHTASYVLRLRRSHQLLLEIQELFPAKYHMTQTISSIYVLIYEAVCRRSDEALEFMATRTLVKKNAADAVASLNQNHC